VIDEIDQSGQKQDCERAAVKRWLAHHQPRYRPKTITYLGDDLYANQPLCQLIDQTYDQSFLFVCKPDSHTTLYQWLAALEKAGGLETRQVRQWNGKHGEIWQSPQNWLWWVAIDSGLAGCGNAG
jgi:hypothetical protein